MSFIKPIYQDINSILIGQKVKRPKSGTLSGHAAGEPFE
ncbi:TPA: HincII family type II restriction endonuclease, partial [Haemophilus influenzae]